jgi:DNA-binding MarR family transcriptional regulator
MIGGTSIVSGQGDSLHIVRDSKEVTSFHSLPLLNHLSRLGTRAADAALAPTGLKPRHLLALMLLDQNGAATQQSLAAALSLDPSNVVGLLNELECRALIVRRRDPDDRRRHIVEVSDQGRTDMVAAQGRIATAEEQVLGCLSLEERAVLHELLVKAIGGQPPVHTCLGH